jgi:hypothetical protein
MSQVYTEIYTEKSFVVRGDTKSHKESLKLLKGKWNASLTDKSSGERFGGWIYPIGKKESVDKWIEEGCQQLVTTDNPPLPHQQVHHTIEISSPNKHESIPLIPSHQTFSQIQVKIDLLEKRVKELELMIGKNSDTDSSSVEEETADDGEQVIAPRRLLLSK